MQTNKPKIAIYAISKNEEMFVERFANSAKDADLIIVADTGSTDRTVELCKNFGILVFDICITPWRFDKARDAALALVPRDVDICVSLDLDEVMEEGWREEIEKVWEMGKTTRLRYGYDWGQGLRFQYEKIHARHGYHWHHPCHEYPRPDVRIQEVMSETQKLLVRHLPDPTKSRGQYLDLLKLSIEEDPSCPRNAFYYARELTFWDKWTEALVQLDRYLNLPGANWINERCYAMRLKGKAYAALGYHDESLKWYRSACAEAPNTREPWCDLSMACYQRGMWPEAYSSAKNALAIVDKQLVYTCDPEAWGPKPYDLASIAAWNLGLKKEAIELAQQALALNPNDQRIKNNIEFMIAT